MPSTTRYNISYLASLGDGTLLNDIFQRTKPTLTEVKRAYLKLCLQTHPDKNQDRKNEATAALQAVGNAFCIVDKYAQKISVQSEVEKNNIIIPCSLRFFSTVEFAKEHIETEVDKALGIIVIDDDDPEDDNDVQTPQPAQTLEPPSQKNVNDDTEDDAYMKYEEEMTETLEDIFQGLTQEEDDRNNATDGDGVFDEVQKEVKEEDDHENENDYDIQKEYLRNEGHTSTVSSDTVPLTEKDVSLDKKDRHKLLRKKYKKQILEKARESLTYERQRER